MPKGGLGRAITAACRPVRHVRFFAAFGQSHRAARPARDALCWRVGDPDSVHPAGRLASNGLEAWAQVLERGYEGLVAKDESSLYVGGRTRLWVKVKQENWTEGEDRWRRTMFAP